MIHAAEQAESGNDVRLIDLVQVVTFREKLYLGRGSFLFLVAEPSIFLQVNVFAFYVHVLASFMEANFLFFSDS